MWRNDYEIGHERILALERMVADITQSLIPPVASQQNRTSRPSVMDSLTNMWRTRNRRIGLSHALSPAGDVIHDADQGAQTLLSYWAEVFAHKPVEDSALNVLVRHCDADALSRIDWSVFYEEFLGALRARRDSSPGPDGIPYSAWIASEASWPVLFRCYNRLANGDTDRVPEDFNHAWLWLLPKGASPSDSDSCVSRSASRTRPLSGSNTISKLFPAMLTHVL